MKEFAFWRYDLFPYIVGGQVISKGKDEKGVFVEALDKGYYWRPFKIMPYDKGIKIYNKLMELKEEHRAELQKLSDIYRDKAKKIFPCIPALTKK